MKHAAIFGMLLTATCAAKSDFYVAPSGQDRNPGTAPRPFATLARAQIAAREQRPAIVHVAGGFYALPETWRFDARDSDTQYIAVAGETPVISGGRRVTGWKQEGKLWQAPVAGNPRALFVNGQRCQRARQPNADFFTGLQTADGVTLHFPPGQLGAWQPPGEVELVTLVEWTTSRVRLPAFDPAANTIVFPRKILPFIEQEWAQHIKANVPQFPYYFENAREFLDQPGEWYFDRATSRLSYWPMPGETLASVHAVVAHLPTLIEAEGVARLRFRGLTFAHADWQLPTAGFFPNQTCMTEPVSDRPLAAIRLRAAVDCSFEQCTFTGMDRSAVGVERRSRGTRISRCEFADIGGNALEIGEHNQLDEAEVVRDTRVEDNHIHHGGTVHHGAAGIYVALSRGTVIAHNLLHDLPYSGIAIGWNWTHQTSVAASNTVAFNHIHHVGTLLADAAGIYALGKQPGSRMESNLIHDITRRYGVAGVNAVFLDNGSEGWHIAGNVSYNVGDGGLRFNTGGAGFTQATGPEFQSLGTNYFDVAPGQSGYPAHIALQAGPQPVTREETHGE